MPDYCIVGSGPAGAILATRLAQAGRTVVLVEQGERRTAEQYAATAARMVKRIAPGVPDVDDDQPSFLKLPFSAVAPASSRQTPYVYGHQAGLGGTVHWSGWASRPHADDLLVRSRFGYGRDWPLSYEALEPWLLEAERELGVAGAADDPYASPRSGAYPMPPHAPSYFDRAIFAPACGRLGWAPHAMPMAINSIEYQGRPACQSCRFCSACPSGAKYSADRVHVPRLAALPNAEILTGTRVRRLETNASGDRIEVAHCVRVATGEAIPIRADRFILAANGVETPRLLLLSGEPRHPRGLGNQGGALGSRFGGHLVTWGTIWLKENPGIGKNYYHQMVCDHFRRRARDTRHPVFDFTFMAGALWDPSHMLSSVAAHDRLRVRDLALFRRETIGFLAGSETTCTGRLTLSDAAKDHFGDPLAEVAFTLDDLDDFDRSGAARAREAMMELAGAMAARSVRTSWESQPPGPSSAAIAGPPVGGCPVSQSPDDGVCDPNLRVWGVDNLFLATTGVFPSNQIFSKTLVVVALALRLGDHLLRGE